MRRFDINQDDWENKICASIQFLQTRKNQLQICLNAIHFYLLPVLVHEENIEPTIIKENNPVIMFSFDDIHMLDVTKCHYWAKSLDSILEAYKI